MGQFVNNSAEKRFEYRSADGVAMCEYEVVDGVWYLNHTIVPDSMRGQGVAAQLAQFALNHVDAQKETLVPRCSYIAGFIEKHSNYARLLAFKK